MYKVEIFSDKMEFVSVAFANESQTIDLDYLSYNPYSIQTGLVDCKKGYFVHITSVEDNRYVADGIISDVQPDKYTQKISIRPLQALFDADIFSTKITDCVTWIKDAITSIFITNADSLQNRPIKLTYTKPSDDLPLTESFDEKQDDTFNILSVISAALKHYNVVTACYLDMKNMRIRVRIYQNKETKTIEGDLENVINSSATLGDSYGSINKVVVRRFMNLGSGYLRCDTPEASLAKTVDVGEEFALDTNGYYTIQFSEKVKANSKIDFIDESKSGECTTAEGTLEKTVTIQGYDPSDGYLWVVFKSPVPTGSTLKVNNKTAYPIYKDGAPIPSGTIPVDYPAYLAFDGSHYIYAKTDVPIYVNGRAVHDDEIPPEKICLFQFNGTQLGFVKAYPEDTEESLLIGYLSYFRGIDGKIGTNIKTSNRIVPVFVRHISIEQPSELSYANWKKEALLQSAEILTPEQYDQEIQLTYHINDKIVHPLDMSIGTVTTIYYKGELYTSIYTEKKLNGNLITLIFGAVRTDLTKKLSNKEYSGSSSGGGGKYNSSSSGGESGGTKNYNSLTNKPSINGVTLSGDKSLSELGIPTSYTDLSNKPSINGTTLSGNKSLSDLGIPTTYGELSDKPSINNVTLSGNKSLSDLGIPTTYAELSDKPSINGTTLSGNKTAAELGLQNELTAGNMVDITNDTVSAVIPFAEAEATSRTVFTATVPTIRSLEDGVTVLLCNTSGFVSNKNWTLNVNGLGALHVFNSMSMAQMTTQFAANATYLFTYDSSLEDGAGGWYMYTGYNSDTNTQAYLIRNYNATLVMKNTLYSYMICFTDHDGLLVPTANVSNSTSVTKTLTTDSFDPFGDIYYYSTTATVTPGSSPSASYMWKMRNDCNMRYGWNVSTTDFELKKSVYVRCVPQSDGQVKLDGNDCIVQALPTTEDGKVYIYLGRAYSGYQMELYFTHPVYYYKDGAIRTWDAGDYSAGNGIAISNREISIADLIIDCGSSTVNVGV